MGICASEPATPEEQQGICKAMAKEMMLISVNPALGRCDQIKVTMPPAFDQMGKASADLKKMAEESKNKPEASQAEAEELWRVNGGIMGMLGIPHRFVTAGVESAANLAMDGVSAGLVAAADVLDKASKEIEGPMSTIGKDICAAKKEEISKVLCKYIVESKIEGAVELCKGPPDTAISDYLVGQASKHITTQLMGVVGEVIDGHQAIEAWRAAIYQYNAAIEQVGKLKMGWKMGYIVFDINKYICEQTVLGLAKEMGKDEAEVRKNPTDKANNHKVIFFKVFNGDQLTKSDYKTVCLEIP